MFVKQPAVWASAIVLAALTAGCSGMESAAAPTAPSAIDRSTTSALSNTQAAALTASCRVGSGDAVITPGPPPPSNGSPGTSPQAGTSPGTAPGPAAPGTQLAVGGNVENRTGDCPEITFGIGGRIVRIDATTSFGSGSCSLLENGDLVGVTGTAQSDGSIVASCVAVGL